MILLYVTYMMVCGVRELEISQSRDLGSGAIRTNWIAGAVVKGMIFLFALISTKAVVLLVVIDLTVSIAFLYNFNRSKRTYYGVF